MYYIGNIPFGYSDVRHYGVLGMKWGVRKQPESSSGGIRRFRTDQGSQSDIQKRERRHQRIKTGLKIGASVVAAGLIAYGGKKLVDLHVRNKKLIDDTFNKIASINNKNRADMYSFNQYLLDEVYNDDRFTPYASQIREKLFKQKAFLKNW